MYAFLFDLDGVLVDTAKYHYLAWKRLADELGFYFSPEDNERLKGISRMKSLDILLEIGNISLDEETKKDLAERKNRWYVEYIEKMTPDEILPGALSFLEKTRKAGIKTALGSASKNASLILKKTGLHKYFDAIVDGTKVSKAKPDPEIFITGARELNVDNNSCVVFEDAKAGIEAAKRAGMKAVGIGKKHVLYDADMIINGLSEADLDSILNLF